MNTGTRAQEPDFVAWFGQDAFDASYGYDLAGLRAIDPPEPVPGFAEHWRGRYTAALRVRPGLRRQAAGTVGDHDLYTVRFTTTGGRVLGGWLAIPRSGPVRRGVIHSHGYGGRTAIDPLPLAPDTAVLWPVARGLPSASTAPDLPSVGAEHVLVGIDSADTYILGGCAEDVWCAATALHEQVGPVPLDYVGTSFGGGVGALALPWDDRFHSGTLQVPSFGHYDLRLQMPCTGSGESVRRHVEAHPQARAVLDFFDAAVAARYLDVPMLIGCALWDPAVPPPGQFAVLNAVAHAEPFVLSAGHTDYPGAEQEDAAWRERVRTFLTARSTS